MNWRERFDKFILKTDTCRLWQGAKNSAGYGQFSKVDAVPTPREVLIDYLFVKAHQADWHAVRDAAVDLELLELRMELEARPIIREADLNVK